MATVMQKEKNIDQEATSGTSDVAAQNPDIATKKSRKPLLFGALAVLGVVAAIMAVRFVIWSSGHVSTDDATITSDVVAIAPQVSGTVISVPVSENQHVKKGDLLVQLDSASYETAVAQAKANLELAIAQAKGAAATVSLTQQNAAAQIQQAQGIVGQSTGSIEGSVADFAKASSAISQAKAQASGADASYYGAKANVSIAVANKQKALDAVAGAQAQLDTAKAALNTAKANVEAMIATADNADKQAVRNETLFRQGAVSGQVAEASRAAADVAKAQVAASQQQVEQAKAVVAQRQSDLRSARNQLPAADAAISQAKALLSAAQNQVQAARSTIDQVKAQAQSAKAAIAQAKGKGTQASGQLLQANEGSTQVVVSQTAQMQAEARVAQAQAALKDAEINLSRTKIVSPADGRVSKNSVDVGNLVQPGGTLMAIFPDEDAWVTANFKETQLADVKPGQEVDVEVDALPGKVYKGKVGSISAGTGATFALLPPDNATGNFTKVVQRLSVKILLDHGQPDMDRLRTGMSVTATITTK